MQFVDVSLDFTFGGIEVYACPYVELLNYFQERDHIFNRVGEEGAVVGVLLAGKFKAT